MRGFYFPFLKCIGFYEEGMWREKVPPRFENEIFLEIQPTALVPPREKEVNRTRLTSTGSESAFRAGHTPTNTRCRRPWLFVRYQ